MINFVCQFNYSRKYVKDGSKVGALFFQLRKDKIYVDVEPV